jgi:N-formylglutamate amidohydrolase
MVCNSNKFNVIKSKTSPLIIMSPHSGRNYESSFLNQTKVFLKELRKSEDSYIDLIFKESHLDFNFIKANFPRIFVDVNRSPLEIDALMWDSTYNHRLPYNNSVKVLSGIGVFPKVSLDGIKIYEELLPFSEARNRLLKYYFPYHKKIKLLINEVKKIHKTVIALDCHSMASKIVDDETDIILSNNFGRTSNMFILNKLKQSFLSFGYKVKINKPFKGGFITRYYGNPQNNIHFIQIEVNKNLYLFENNYRIKKKKFENLKNCFLEIINYINSVTIK